MLCSKHFLESEYFCIKDCCLFQRRKCQQCIKEDSNVFKNSSLHNSSFFDHKKNEQASRNRNNVKQFDLLDHELLNYESLKVQINEIVKQIKQEFNQVVDNQNAYIKIHQIFQIIKDKINQQLDQAEQHVLHSLTQFYQKIHDSDLSHKINVLYSKLKNDECQNNQQHQNNNFQTINQRQNSPIALSQNITNNQYQNNDFNLTQYNTISTNNTISTPSNSTQNSLYYEGQNNNTPNKSNNPLNKNILKNSIGNKSNSQLFLSFSNKYFDEFVADLILNNNGQRANNPFSPLEIENQKLKEVFQKLKNLTCVAENFSSQSIGFIFEEKCMPQIDCSVQRKEGIQSNQYKTNLMHQHSMQVKCVQNLGNQFIVSCGFDKKIKISTTLKNEKHSLVEDIQLKHNIVCTDLIRNQFVCGNEIGEGLLFYQQNGQFKKVSDFKLHESLVYAIRFLNRDEVISGSINELCLFNIRKMKKIQTIKYSNNIITDICLLNESVFLIGDSSGSIYNYKKNKTNYNKLSLVKQYKIHKRPIIKLERLKNNKSHVISGSRDQNIIIFNLTNSQIVKQITIQNPLVTLCLLSSFEIVSSDQKTIYFHNVLTGDLIYKIIPQSNTISCIDCNPLTKTIYIGQGKQVCSIQFS